MKFFKDKSDWLVSSSLLFCSSNSIQYENQILITLFLRNASKEVSPMSLLLKIIVIFHLRWALKASTTKSEGSSFCNSFKSFRRNKAEAAFGDLSHWRAQALIVLLCRRCIGSHHHSWQYSITRGHHCTVNTESNPAPTSEHSLSSQTMEKTDETKAGTSLKVQFSLRAGQPWGWCTCFLALPNHFSLPPSQHPLPYCYSFSAEDHAGLSSSLLLSHRFLCGDFVKNQCYNTFQISLFGLRHSFLRAKMDRTSPSSPALISCSKALQHLLNFNLSSRWHQGHLHKGFTDGRAPEMQ